MLRGGPGAHADSSKKGAHGRVEEAAALRGAVSGATGRRYPLTMICAVFRVARLDGLPDDDAGD